MPATFSGRHFSGRLIKSDFFILYSDKETSVYPLFFRGKTMSCGVGSVLNVNWSHVISDCVTIDKCVTLVNIRRLFTQILPLNLLN